jgi:hypothetical protein
VESEDFEYLSFGILRCSCMKDDSVAWTTVPPRVWKHRATRRLRGGAGITPGPLETSALITIWATLKLPQCSRFIELWESADELLWAIGRAGAMAVMCVQIAKTASRAVERTEPDVHLIKQVEQVTKSALEGPTWRFAGIPSMGVTDAVEILVFLIWQLPHWLLFGCKTAKPIQKRPGVEHAKSVGQTRSGQFLPCFASSFFSRLATPVAPRSRA